MSNMTFLKVLLMNVLPVLAVDPVSIPAHTPVFELVLRYMPN